MYSLLAAIGLACLASTAILHMRARTDKPVVDEGEGCAWA